MKTLFNKILILFALLLGVTACSTNDWEDVPEPIVEFVSEYFPLQRVSGYGYNGTTYHVKLNNSTGLSFDSQYKWQSVNGYGSTLPEMFLFDELPPALYEYLQDMSLLDGVYSVSRDAFTYNVALLDSSITYTISTGLVTPDVPASTAIAQLRFQ